ncbi:hypothetical protein HanRHA438_Chr14g0660761 [Helianthus annuus]|nr:hypothetical protein HanRHA438_Chr14g0660761 [Helianthus annuus]
MSAWYQDRISTRTLLYRTKQFLVSIWYAFFVFSDINTFSLVSRQYFVSVYL